MSANSFYFLVEIELEFERVVVEFVPFFFAGNKQYRCRFSCSTGFYEVWLSLQNSDWSFSQSPVVPSFIMSEVNMFDKIIKRFEKGL